MAKQQKIVDHVLAALKADAASPYPKYPAQALQALRDDALVNRVSERLAGGAKLRGVHLLEYDFKTGLNRVCFEFDDLDSVPSTGAILALTDGNCRVIGVIDPSTRNSRTGLSPPLAEIGGAVPFILDRPSAARDLPFSPGDLEPHDQRRSAFLARMTGGGFGWWGGGMFDADPCGPEAQTTQCTYVSFTMHSGGYPPATPLDRPFGNDDQQTMDNNPDDCGIPF